MGTAVDKRGEDITKLRCVPGNIKAVNASYNRLVNSFIFLVGVVGFEPTTPYTPCRCPAGLGHTPTLSDYNTLKPGVGGVPTVRTTLFLEEVMKEAMFPQTSDIS